MMQEHITLLREKKYKENIVWFGVLHRLQDDEGLNVNVNTSQLK